MTLTFQFRAPRFHPAWLVPPLVPLAQWIFGGPGAPWSLVVQLVLTLLISVVTLYLAREDRTRNCNRWSKELRLLMPPAVGTLVIPAALHNDLSELAVMLHCVGCVWMGATVFGAEFEHRTLGPLLTQPISRKRIFWEKLGILSVLSLVVYGNTMASLERVQGSVDWDILAVAPALAVSTGPLFSLLGRSTLAGMVFTATAPMLFLLLSAIVTGSIQSGMPVLSDPPTAEQLKAIEPYNQALFLWGDFQPWLRGLYLAAGPLLGWLWFRSLSWQDGAAVARPPSGSASSRAVLTRLIRILVPGASATAHLIRKEIRLHVIPWMVAALTTGLWILWMIARSLAPEGDLKDGLNEFSPITVIGGMLGVVALVTAGAGSVAEERALGTLDWQVTQPVTGRRQWWIKSLVAVVTGLVTGLLIPATLLAVGFGPERWEKEGLVVEQLPAMTFAMGIALTLTLSLYASSIARNTMRAVGLTVLMAAAAVAMVFAVAIPGVNWVNTQAWANYQAIFDFDGAPRSAWHELNRIPFAGQSLQKWVTRSILFSCGLVVLHWAFLACANFARPNTASFQIRRQWILLSGFLTLLVVINVGIFAQVWFVQQTHEKARYDEFSKRRWDLLESKLNQLAVNGSLSPAVAEWLELPPGSVKDALQNLAQQVDAPGSRRTSRFRELNDRIEQPHWLITSKLQALVPNPKSPLPDELRRKLDVQSVSHEEAAWELLRRHGPIRAIDLVFSLQQPANGPLQQWLGTNATSLPPSLKLSPELRRRYNLPDPPRR